jgi:hypothetical protein
MIALSESDLNSIILKVITFQSTSSNQHDELDYLATSRALKYICSQASQVMFLSENLAVARNRLRSYRGLINKSVLKSGRAMQIELDMRSGCSIFGGIVDLHGVTDKQGFENLYGGCPFDFVLTSKTENLFRFGVLEEILKECIHFDGDYAFVNYAVLVKTFTQRRINILRFGGDGGDQEISVQVFANAADFDSLNHEL